MLLARMNPSGDVQYYHTDIRGSVILITDENGDITHQYQYEDFGSVTKSFEPDNDPNRFKYVGGYGVEYDTEDLYYMRARYYKPSIGRFLTEDRVWSTNLYSYSGNNPITNIDRNGHSLEDVLSIAEAGGVDAFSVGGEAGFALPVGVGIGIRGTYILTGEDKGKCPLISASFNINGGVAAGASVFASGQKYSGQEGYQKEYINSNLFEDGSANFSLDVVTAGLIGGQSQPNGTNGSALYNLGLSIGPGFGFQVSTTGERILFDTNRIYGALQLLGIQDKICRK